MTLARRHRFAASPTNPPRTVTPADNDATGRRDFLAHVASAAAVLAATACATAPVAAAAKAAAPRPTTPPPPQHWDDSWTARVSAAKHKAVFDTPAIADGVAFANAYVFMLTYNQMYGTTDADTVPVVVIRHAAIPLAVDDDLWTRYELGKEFKVKDGATGKWARRNPYLHVDPNDKDAFPPATIEALAKRGTIFLGCALAAGRLAGQIAKKGGASHDDAMAEVRAHLIPGLTLMPSGILATVRAQEAGAAFIRST